MLRSIYKVQYMSTKMPQTKPIASIENVMASASLDQKIDLNVITQTFPDQSIIYILF